MSKSEINLWFVFWPIQILALLGIISTSPNWLYLLLATGTAGITELCLVVPVIACLVHN